MKLDFMTTSSLEGVEEWTYIVYLNTYIRLPSYLKYLAVDENGTLYGHKTKPRMIDFEFQSKSKLPLGSVILEHEEEWKDSLLKIDTKDYQLVNYYGRIYWIPNGYDYITTNYFGDIKCYTHIPIQDEATRIWVNPTITSKHEIFLGNVDTTIQWKHTLKYIKHILIPFDIKYKEAKYNPNNFIVFEGIDGSGKSTGIQYAKEYLENKGYKVVVLSDPYLNDPLTKQLREMVKFRADLTDFQKLSLFITARIKLFTDYIVPALKTGKIVLCDRYDLSTLCYQGLILKDNHIVNTMCKMFAEDISNIAPTNYFIFRCSLDTCTKRIQLRSPEVPIDTFEKREFLCEVNKRYAVYTKHLQGHLTLKSLNKKSIFKDNQSFIIRSEKTPENVRYQIEEKLEKLGY